MKKLAIFGAISTVLIMAGCAEKKPATAEQIWTGYCTSVGNAARSITLDRQNGITQKEAVDNANKVTDPTTRAFITAQIEKVYAFPVEQLKADRDGVQAKFKQEAFETCLNTPHDPNKMPDYKPF